jgi:hypothetical protein
MRHSVCLEIILSTMLGHHFSPLFGEDDWAKFMLEKVDVAREGLLLRAA